MSLLLCAIYLLSITALGYAAAAFVLGPAERHWAEVAGLSFAAGAGICSVGLFLFSLAGRTPTRVMLAGICALAAVLIAILWKRNRWLASRSPQPLPRRWDAWESVGALAALLI